MDERLWRNRCFARAEAKGRLTFFVVGSQRTLVDPADFVPAMLDEVIAWFTWVEAEIGLGASDILTRAQALHASL